MPEWKMDALQKSLKDGTVLPFYFLYGPEQYPLEQFLKNLSDKLINPAFEQFNLQRFDESATLNDLETAYEALPMMAEYKCVFVRNFPVGSMNKADFEALSSLCKDPNPSTVLVFYYTDADYAPKKANEKNLIKLISKQGAVVQFEIQDPATLAKLLMAYAKKKEVLFPKESARLLIERCGSSYQELQSETDKLIAYAGPGGTILEETVQLLTAQSFQDSAFDLCSALLSGKSTLAFRLLDHLFYQRVEPMMILGALASAFGDLYRAKAGQAAHVTDHQIIEDFHYGRNSFRITKYSRMLRSYPLERIRFCIKSLMEANQQLLSSQAEERLILEEAMAKMLSYQSVSR